MHQERSGKMEEVVDFVICWVDGNDVEWQIEKDRHTPGIKSDSRIIRYRDWDNLEYWFRGVERFAPWVNKIHFVTWGHIPSWLDTNHPKINIVKHEDYIPEKYLPTFSARPIEVNFHRIEGLAEQFVYFNDDMFLTQPVSKKDFFINGKPRDVAVMDIGIKNDDAHGSAIYNSLLIINKHFNKSDSLKKNFLKWYNPLYGKMIVKTLLLSPWKYFSGFYTLHLPNAYVKSTFIEVWNKEKEILELTSSNKFRTKLDVTQYLFKYWQLAAGNFAPGKKIGKKYSLGIKFEDAQKAIEEQKHKIICLNDDDVINDFESVKESIKLSLNTILPKKSEFEKK